MSSVRVRSPAFTLEPLRSNGFRGLSQHPVNLAIVNPSHGSAVSANFYFIAGLDNGTYAIGVIQLVVILGVVADFKKRWTYLLALLFHAVSTFSAFCQCLAPDEGANLLLFGRYWSVELRL